jgi:uncharacterized protein (DUF2141 family)
MRRILLLAALAVTASPATAGDLALSVEGVRNGKGSVSICLFRQAAGFPDCNRSPSAVRRTLPAAEAAEPILFKDLPPGPYAVTVLHDENADGRLDTNMLGIPKEGVGISNNRMPRFSAPTYADAEFDLPKGRRQAVRVVYW